MRRTSVVAASVAIATALTLGRPQPAAAQSGIPLGGGTLSGSAEMGGRGSLGSLDARQLGKLEEYKDVPSRALLEQLLLRWTPSDSFRLFQLSARKVGALDQSVWFRGTQPGLYDVQLRWDRIPHTFSTTGRWLGTEPSPGVYALPTPRPDTAAFNRAPYLQAIRSRWEPIKLSTTVTPDKTWDLKAEYTHIAKSGDRPMGMPFGGPSSNAREILEPIDQTMHDLKLTESWAHPGAQLLVTYDLSLFQQRLTSVTSDNPLLTADTPTGGSSRGRTALPPSNRAQTVVATGGLNLPRSTRLMGTISHSWWRQDQAFVAQTINGAITDPRQYTLPASLGGNTQVQMTNLSLSSRPLSPITVTARWRSYAFRDRATNTAMPVIIVNDRSVSPADTARRDPFTRDTRDIGLGWHVLGPVTISAGFAWERMSLDSSVRNITSYTERTPRVSVDFNGIDWLGIRASWSKGWRRNADYHQMASSDLPEFRRYDIADRDRERVGLLATLVPIDQVDVTGTLEAGHDTYPSSQYGLRSDNSVMLGGDVDWAPSRRFTIGAGYAREKFDDLQRARYRTGTQLTNLTFDWVGKNADRTATVSANLTAVLVPDRLDIGGTYELSTSRFRMLASNPTTPTGGTAAQNTSATAVDFPEVSQKLQPIGTFLRYRLNAAWSTTLRYQGELYRQNDFRTLGLSPAVGNYIFLGNDFQSYDARFLTITITYGGPMMTRFGRSTL